MCLDLLRHRAHELARLPRQNSRSILKHLCPERALQKAHERTAVEKGKWEPMTLPAVAQGSHYCPFCQKSFSSKAACASHQSSRHGVGIVLDSVSGSVCHVCRQQWWSTYRRTEHLRSSLPCRAAWNHADLNAPLPFEATGHRQDRAWKPPATIAGPQPFWATLRPVDAGTPQVNSSAPSAAVTAKIRETAAGPQNQTLAIWFQGLYRLCLEHSERLTGSPFVPGSLAFDAFALCKAIPQGEPGKVLTQGQLQCLLEERHKAWLRQS